MFAVFVTCNLIAALMALFVLKPMRAAHFAKSRAAFPEQPAGAAVRNA